MRNKVPNMYNFSPDAEATTAKDPLTLRQIQQLIAVLKSLRSSATVADSTATLTAVEEAPPVVTARGTVTLMMSVLGD